MESVPRLLIVVHDQHLRAILHALLALEGYQLQFMQPGQPIGSVVDQTSPDVILLDTAPPDSFEQCRALKAHPCWRSIPVILFVPSDNEAFWEQGCKAGADEFVTIPLQKHELTARIRSMLRLNPQDIQSSKAFDPQTHRKPMLRGFVHEMSNTLTSNMLVLATVLKDDITLCQQNAEYLQHAFNVLEPELSDDIRDSILECFQKIDQNEETLDRILKIVNDSNDRAICRTKQVSEYAKLEYLPVQIQPIQVAQIIKTVLRQHQADFEQHHISVSVHDTSHHALVGHKPHFLAIFKHLIQNASQALAEREDENERLLEITLSETGDEQTITVRDTGKGISEEDLHEIFEPFYTTRPKTRAGLGLNFVAKLTAMYAGTVHVESLPEHGTTVTLCFPVMRET